MLRSDFQQLIRKIVIQFAKNEIAPFARKWDENREYPEEIMKKVVGIRFKSAGKVYDFDCGAFVLKRGDCVIVETEQGLAFGTVVIAPVQVEEGATDKPLKKVHRLANEKDFQQLEKSTEEAL